MVWKWLQNSNTCERESSLFWLFYVKLTAVYICETVDSYMHESTDICGFIHKQWIRAKESTVKTIEWRHNCVLMTLNILLLITDLQGLPRYRMQMACSLRTVIVICSGKKIVYWSCQMTREKITSCENNPKRFCKFFYGQ